MSDYCDEHGTNNCESCYIVKLQSRIAELENLLVECRGFDCCPLASKLNAADDRIAELEKVAEAAQYFYGYCRANYPVKDLRMGNTLRAAGYLKGEASE